MSNKLTSISASLIALALTVIGVSNSAFAVPFNVDSRTAWQDTGIDISVGDVLDITASGSIRYASPLPNTDPDGNGGTGVFGLIHLTPGVPAQTLVGRIGSSGSLSDLSGFFVGSNYSATATQPGRLFLGFNDGFVLPNRTGLNSGGVGDNSGSFSTNIQINASTGAPPSRSSVNASPDNDPLVAPSALTNVIAGAIGVGIDKGLKLFPIGDLLGFFTADDLVLDGACGDFNFDTGQFTNTNCPYNTDIHYTTPQSPASFSIDLPTTEDFVGVSFEFIPFNLSDTDIVYAFLDDQLLYSVPGSNLTNNQRNHSLFVSFPSSTLGSTFRIGVSSNQSGQSMVVRNVVFAQQRPTSSDVPEPTPLSLIIFAAVAGGISSWIRWFNRRRLLI